MIGTGLLVHAAANSDSLVSSRGAVAFQRALWNHFGRPAGVESSEDEDMRSDEEMAPSRDEDDLEYA